MQLKVSQQFSSICVYATKSVSMQLKVSQLMVSIVCELFSASPITATTTTPTSPTNIVVNPVGTNSHCVD